MNFIRKMAKKIIHRAFISECRQLNDEFMRVYGPHLAPSEYERALSVWFYLRMGYYPDLRHPKTFEEKIQWLKLNDSTPEKTRLADKYLVREFIEERIGKEYLIPLLGVYDTFEEIDLDSLPRRFVMKANHGSHFNVIVDDRKDFDAEDARRKFHDWLTTDYAWKGGFELHYSNIVPKIVVEENISEDGEDLKDYKIWCMDGKPTYILVISGRKGTRPSMAFFDTQWKLQPFINSTAYERCTENIPRPENLDKMLELAGKLSAGFYFVRVDFYDTAKGIRFGEMTFTPSSGIMHWKPAEYGRICGDLIHLPCDDE